jgi:hypothetical protein
VTIPERSLFEGKLKGTQRKTKRRQAPAAEGDENEIRKMKLNALTDNNPIANQRTT